MKHFFLCLLVFLLAACANRGSGPQGGPQDVAPPVVKESTPENRQTNFQKGEITIEFDEFVALDKPMEKIIVSPPQIVPPAIRASGKKVIVSFNDSLQTNTAYSIDFTNSIIDLNERNPLENYVFSFSTGENLDSLQISGTLIDAATLNPLSGYTVGIYANLDDTAFTSIPPLRIGRTNEKGEFSIKNIKTNSYHIFGLNDLNRDFFFNDPSESIAFLDSVVVPSCERVQHTDTLKIDTTAFTKKKKKNDVQTPDSLLKDSIITVWATKFSPGDVLLKAFKEEIYRQRFLKAERKEAHRVNFFFFAENKEKPQIRLLNASNLDSDLLQFSAKMDSITYWVADSATLLKDSLQFEISYLKTDSLGNLQPQTDSVFTVFKHIQANKKTQKKEEPKTRFLNIKHNAQGALDFHKPVALTFDMPVVSFDTAHIRLSRKPKADSIWVDIPIEIERKDSIGLYYEIAQEWNSDLDYKLQIDSVAILNLYGLHNNKVESKFTVKGLEQYSTLIITLLNYNEKAVIQVLNTKDEVVQQYPAEEDGTIFEFLTPGDYYVRLFIDENRNEKWDTGNYTEKRQPEEVYYFNDKIQLRANWDVEQEWDYLSVPLLNQKPSSLVSAKKQ